MGEAVDGWKSGEWRAASLMHGFVDLGSILYGAVGAGGLRRLLVGG